MSTPRASNATHAYNLAHQAARDLDSAATSLFHGRLDLALARAEVAKEGTAHAIRRIRTEARRLHRAHAEGPPVEHCVICEERLREQRILDSLSRPSTGVEAARTAASDLTLASCPSCDQPRGKADPCPHCGHSERYAVRHITD